LNKYASRIYYLDLIRMFAILIIVIYHFNCTIVDKNINAFHYFLYENDFISWGVVGVKLFLMVSGAALMYHYHDDLKVNDFYKKRVKSIFPLFYLVYLLAFISRYFVLHSPLPDIPAYRFIFTVLGLDGYLSQYTPMFNLVGDWFIGVILIYYGLFPLFRKLVLQYSKVVLSISLLCLIISIYINPFHIEASTSILGNLFPFVFGMIFAYKKECIIQNKIFLMIFILFLLINNKILISISLSIFIFLFLYWISHKIKKHLIVYRISKYSYAMFLVHHILLSFVFTLLSGMTFSFFSITLLLVLCILIIIVISRMVLYMNHLFTLGRNKLEFEIFRSNRK
jgi:peptidoglycan/LPS O-acetylase OafA/YrhL